MGYRTMNKRDRRQLAILVVGTVLVALVGGCGGPVEPEFQSLLLLPEVSAVVNILPSTPTQWGTKITDPNRIEEVLDSLHDLRIGWELVTDPSMMPHDAIRHSAQVSGEDTILLMLRIGDDWIGASDIQGRTSVVQKIAGPELEKLLGRLGFEVDSDSEHR